MVVARPCFPYIPAHIMHSRWQGGFDEGRALLAYVCIDGTPAVARVAMSGGKARQRSTTEACTFASMQPEHNLLHLPSYGALFVCRCTVWFVM